MKGETMGWLCWNTWISSRKDIDEIIRKGMGDRFEVLKSCCRGYTWWVAAIRDKETGDVWAGIAKYHWNPKAHYFGYKWMDESYGPFFYNYPKSYFKLLTPTKSEFANEWRKKQQEVYDKK